MLRVHVPGLCGFALRVRATTNGAVWHAGVVNLGTQAVETVAGEILPRSAIRWLRYEGAGTWIPPLEAREVILLLAMIGGMPHRRVLELAWEGMKPKDPPASKRPRKHPLPDMGPWREIPVGLTPEGVLLNRRVVLEEDTDAVLVGD
jgi:hypothetical protein